MRSPRGAAVVALVALGALGAGSAAAQPALLYESALRQLDLSPDPILRSPRLLGMGLTLPDDVHNRFNLWDLAGNPAGLMDADSASTFELRPATASASGMRDLEPGSPAEREVLGARQVRIGYELWRRNTETQNAYGIHGELGSLRVDRPFGEDIAERGQFQVPRVTAAFTGAMPFILTERMRYAVRVDFAREVRNDEYHFRVRNPAGEYLSKDGAEAPPPDFFTPVDHEVSSLGGGVAFSYRFGAGLTASVGYDGVSAKIDGENSATRYFSGTAEERFYNIGQAALVGRFGPLELGADGRGWRSNSEERYQFTLSGGIGQTPFNGRGKRLDREEEGSNLNARARVTAGPLQVGGGLLTGYRKVMVDPAIGPDGWNVMVADALARTDTLTAPDFVETNISAERSWEASTGATWRLPWSEGLVGAELHVLRSRIDQSRAGSGPLRKAWDARAGLEVPFTAALQGRLGYIYRDDDRDDFTRGNEWISNTVAAGLGLAPAGALWTLDAGYAIEFLQPDYPDPTEGRESRQRLAAQMRWAF
jgi:hypothetical protein